MKKKYTKKSRKNLRKKSRKNFRKRTNKLKKMKGGTLPFTQRSTRTHARARIDPLDSLRSSQQPSPDEPDEPVVTMPPLSSSSSHIEQSLSNTTELSRYQEIWKNISKFEETVRDEPLSDEEIAILKTNIMSDKEKIRNDFDYKQAFAIGDYTKHKQQRKLDELIYENDQAVMKIERDKANNNVDLDNHNNKVLMQYKLSTAENAKRAEEAGAAAADAAQEAAVACKMMPDTFPQLYGTSPAKEACVAAAKAEAVRMAAMMAAVNANLANQYVIIAENVATASVWADEAKRHARAAPLLVAAAEEARAWAAAAVMKSTIAEPGRLPS